MPSFDELVEAAETKIYKRNRIHHDEEIYDFDEQKDSIEGRALRFAMELYRNMSEEQWLEVVINYGYPSINHLADEAFRAEEAWYPTNRPKTQELLFKRKCIEVLVEGAGWRALINEDKTLTDQAIAYQHKRFDNTPFARPADDDSPYSLFLLDFSDLEKEVKKEASLFPDAEPVQVEAPGNIILSLTTDESAVVVYLDQVHKGKEVTLDSKELSHINSKTPVMEIKRGAESYFVAIFNHIPLVTEGDKHGGTWRKNVKCWVKFFNLEEEHYLFKGQVIVQDWRGWEVKNAR